METVSMRKLLNYDIPTEINFQFQRKRDEFLDVINHNKTTVSFCKLYLSVSVLIQLNHC